MGSSDTGRRRGGRGDAGARAELLAPAGQPDAAYAAFAYGADAVYAGLRSFSARAEAVNFSLDELGEVAAFAHAATPRRRVFVTLNTLVTDAEVDAAIDTLAALSELEADALIVQDLGVARLVRTRFPELRLHASTQMAIHNLAGALALKDLGFARVTLARELTLEEVREIVGRSGLEVEVFAHGALCYSYSGLCFYSSMLRGRSGNRGRCSYPCRDAFEAPAGNSRGAGAGPVHPFSMKDLALPDDLAALRDCGVASFKIEGRMKSPLYVACATALYRGILDGTLTPAQRLALEEDVRTVFSRPWTDLYLKSARNRSVTDPAIVGHRGAPVGRVASAVAAGRRPAWVRFKTRRRVLMHDGLQIDLPGVSRPFGFPVDELRTDARAGRVAAGPLFEAPGGSLVSVRLPADHPAIPEGAVVYCASSQEVKQRYRFTRPKAGEYRVLRDVRVTVDVEPDRLTASGEAPPRRASDPPLSVRVSEDGRFESSRNAGAMAATARGCFERMGETRFRLRDLVFRDPRDLFIPVSVLNRLRRSLTDRLQASVDEQIAQRTAACRASIEAPAAASVACGGALEWSVKTDAPACLSAFEASDWDGVGEVAVAIDAAPLPELTRALEGLAERVGRERLRVTLPPIARRHEDAELRARIQALAAAGWRRWEAANLSAWTYLREAAAADLSADWTVYVTNRAAARQVLAMGASGFVLSPEDGWENMRRLIGAFGAGATVIVYQDTPLFISEACAFASYRGECRGRRACGASSMALVSGAGERVSVVNRGCRSLTLSENAYSIASRLPDLREGGARRLRVDFIYREYTPGQALAVWRAVRAGRRPPRTHEGNFARGLA